MKEDVVTTGDLFGRFAVRDRDTRDHHRFVRSEWLLLAGATRKLRVSRDSPAGLPRDLQKLGASARKVCAPTVLKCELLIGLLDSPILIRASNYVGRDLGRGTLEQVSKLLRA